MKHSQRASRSTIPNLYLYRWIRVCAWMSLSINSFLMIFLLEENSFLDGIFENDSLYFIVMSAMGLIMIYALFDIRKDRRTFKNVIIDCVVVIFFSGDYIFGSFRIIPVMIIEMVVTAIFAIKIHKDDRIVDNWKIVKWWKRKQKERFDKQVQRIVERNRKR